MAKSSTCMVKIFMATSCTPLSNPLYTCTQPQREKSNTKDGGTETTRVHKSLQNPISQVAPLPYWNVKCTSKWQLPIQCCPLPLIGILWKKDLVDVKNTSCPSPFFQCAQPYQKHSTSPNSNLYCPCTFSRMVDTVLRKSVRCLIMFKKSQGLFKRATTCNSKTEKA